MCTNLCLAASAFPSVITADSTHYFHTSPSMRMCVYKLMLVLQIKSNLDSDLPPLSHNVFNAAIYTFLIIRHKKCLQVLWNFLACA